MAILASLSPGTKSAELRIASNDGDENPFVVNLAGAVAATVDMLVDQDFGATIPDGGSRTFFATGVGDSSCLNLNVVNTGNTPLQLTGTPRVLIDGKPARAPWIDLADLRSKGAAIVWTDGDPAVHIKRFLELGIDAAIRRASASTKGRPATIRRSWAAATVWTRITVSREVGRVMFLPMPAQHRNVGTRVSGRDPKRCTEPRKWSVDR